MSKSKVFFGNVRLDDEGGNEADRLAKLQAVAILTSPDPVQARKDYENAHANLAHHPNKTKVLSLLNKLKPGLGDIWTDTAASDTHFELDLHGMRASRALNQVLYSPTNHVDTSADLGLNRAAQQYRTNQVYKRFIQQLLLLASSTSFTEAVLPKDIVKQLQKVTRLKVITGQELQYNQELIQKREVNTNRRCEERLRELQRRATLGKLKPTEYERIRLLAQIYQNQLTLIERQRLNREKKQQNVKGTAIAATAFKLLSASSNILIALGSYVPVINIFSHGLKLGFDMASYAFLIASYNLDPKKTEGLDHSTSMSREEILHRREAAKLHLAAIQANKNIEMGLGVIGTAAMAAAVFLPPLAPILVAFGAVNLLMSNLFSQAAIRTEIELLKKVGIKRYDNGNPICEKVTDKNGKIIERPIRLIKDFDTRLASLEKRLEAKKWSTYAAGSALGGAVGSAAIAGLVALGVASVAFPPLLMAIVAVSIAVTLVCAIVSVKKTQDERNLAAKAELEANKSAVSKMREDLDNSLNEPRQREISQSLASVTVSFQQQEVSRSTSALQAQERSESRSEDRLSEHALRDRVEPPVNLRDIARPAEKEAPATPRKSEESKREQEAQPQTPKLKD